MVSLKDDFIAAVFNQKHLMDVAKIRTLDDVETDLWAKCQIAFWKYGCTPCDLPQIEPKDEDQAKRNRYLAGIAKDVFPDVLHVCNEGGLSLLLDMIADEFIESSRNNLEDQAENLKMALALQAASQYFI